MGLKTIKIGAREAVELACDSVAHRGEPPTAWFDWALSPGLLSAGRSSRFCFCFAFTGGILGAEPPSTGTRRSCGRSR